MTRASVASHPKIFMNKDIITLTLNFDDFNPQAGPDGDFGGLGGEVLPRLLQLLAEFPRLRMTLFTVPNWLDRPFRHHSYVHHARRVLGMRPVVAGWEGDPFRLDKHPNWCDAVRGMLEDGRVELAVHGCDHYNPRRVIHGQEFVDLDAGEAAERLCRAEDIFVAARLPFARGFRAPGWGHGPGTVRALADAGYSFLGLLGSPYRLHEPGSLEGMVLIPQNWSIKEDPALALEVAAEHGVVHAKGHLAHGYGRETIENGLSLEHVTNLRTALRSLEERFDVRYELLSAYADRALDVERVAAARG